MQDSYAVHSLKYFFSDWFWQDFNLFTQDLCIFNKLKQAMKNTKTPEELPHAQKNQEKESYC